MNLKNNYYYFQSALTPKLCDEILQYGKSLKPQTAVTGVYDINHDNSKNLNKKELKNIQKKRKSEIVWISEPWIYKEIHPFVAKANELAGWNFEWHWSEPCQFTKYSVGQHYGWHCDSWEEPYDTPANKDMHGKLRKLSVTISLSDPDEYEGGNLEFDFRNQIDWEKNKKAKIKECTEIRPRGSIIVFPSFVWHRVNPVTKGTRHSLVMWNLGWPFK